MRVVSFEHRFFSQLKKLVTERFQDPVSKTPRTRVHSTDKKGNNGSSVKHDIVIERRELEKDSAAGAMHDGGAELDIGDLFS